MLYSLEYNPKYGQISPNKSNKMDFMELYNFRWKYLLPNEKQTQQH